MRPFHHSAGSTAHALLPTHHRPSDTVPPHPLLGTSPRGRLRAGGHLPRPALGLHRQQAAAYLASLGYVRAPGAPTPPAGIPADVRAFHHTGNSAQSRQAVLYQLRNGRLSSVHYTLRAPAAAVEAAKRSLVAELDGRFGPHRPHPVSRGVLLWNTGTNVVTLRTEPVGGESVLHVAYHAPGSREVA